MKFFPKTVKRAKRVIGLEEIKGNTSFVKSLFISLIKIGKPTQSPEGSAPESFESLGYTAEQLEKTKKALKKFVVFYLAVMGLSTLYFIDCLVHGYFETAILVICFFVFCASQAFRNHFQLFQLRERRLGCTFKEWKASLFSKRSNVQ